MNGMNEGIRFDLEYETMPWHKVDAVVFDIGNILIRYAPDHFLEILFPGEERKQREMLERVYQGPYWPSFDRGTMSYEEAAHRLVEQFGGAYEDYMHALRGWIEIKTPIEEGWRAAERFPPAGNRGYVGYQYTQERDIRLGVKISPRLPGF